MEDFENFNNNAQEGENGAASAEGKPNEPAEPQGGTGAQNNPQPTFTPPTQPTYHQPQTPVTPPAAQRPTYPYGQGAAPNTGYPYSPMPNNRTGSYYNGQQYNGNPYGYAPQNPNAPQGGQVPPVRPAPPAPKKSKTGRVVLSLIIIFILVFALAFLVKSFKKGNSSNPSVNEKTDNVTLPIEESDEQSETASAKKDGALSATDIYEKVNESSVGILVYRAADAVGFSSNLYGEGSGVITEENSAHTGTYIITCAHVVRGDGLTVKVQLNNGEQYNADVVGIDNKTDIAVLIINETGLSAAEFGSTKNIKVGQTVYAIGNPGGTAFFGSFTSGIVSAIARPVNSPVGYEMNCIQHDAAINPGNSGGALVNEYGQVIGINSSKIAAEEYEGMGFAVPSETVKEIADDIISHGYVTDRAKLGISYATNAQSQTYSMIVQLKNYPAGSIIISRIDSDSSLYGTKVQTGDLIIKANGEELTTPDVLLDLVENGHVGDKITLTIVRVGANYETEEFEVTATLVEDRGTTTVEEESTTSQNEFYNPFGFGN